VVLAWLAFQLGAMHRSVELPGENSLEAAAAGDASQREQREGATLELLGRLRFGSGTGGAKPLIT